MENELKEFLAELESWYVKVCRAGSDMEYQAAIEVPEKSEKDPEVPGGHQVSPPPGLF